MSIDPNLINTARVGELPIGSVSLTNKIAHEISNELKQATVQELADVIGAYLGTRSGLAFNPITVSDGQTLPNTTSNEWVLVGKGTFPNVGGGATITTTEELNALVSNGSTWSVGVEIPVNVELAGIVQTIREGYTQTTPSEDKVFKALQLKADTLTNGNVTDAIGYTPADITGYTAKAITSTSTTDADYPVVFSESASGAPTVLHGTEGVDSLLYNPSTKTIKGKNANFSGSVDVPNATSASQAVNKGQLDVKENTSNKQNSLTTDGTGAKFPTVDAVKNRFDNYTTQRSTISEIRVMAGDLRNNLFYTTDSGQEGNWYYDATDTTSADNTGTILVTADGKRIKRVFNDLDCRWFGAKYDGIVDDAIGIQKAVDFAFDKGISEIRILAQVTVFSPITVKKGITLNFGGHDIPRFNNTTSLWENLKGSIIFVKFGQGEGENTTANSAFKFEQGAGIKGVSFNYPEQTMQSLTPVTYPASIVILQDSLENKIEDVNFGNSYIGIDARRNHGQLKLSKINGYPLYRGIRIGGMIDNDLVSDIHFNPAYTYTGTVNKDNSLVNWVWNNGIVLELGRNSWSNYENIFGYNYKRIIYGYKQIADFLTGNTKTGGTETANFKNIGGDSVKGVMEFEGKVGEDGISFSGNSHWGIKIYNLNGVVKSPYDASLTGENLFKWNINTDATRSDFKVFGGRSHDTDDDIFDVDGGEGCLITGFEFYDFAKKVTSGKGVRLNSTKRMKIVSNEADGQNLASTNRFIFLGTTNKGTVISNNTAVDFVNPIVEIQSNSNSFYSIQDNYFNPVSTNNAVLDSQKDVASVIKNNTDTRSATMSSLGNSNVISTDVGGGVFRNILYLPYQGETFNYTGTLDIQGIDGGRRNKIITIRFSSNAVTVKDADTAVPLSQRMELVGDFQNKAESVLTLMTNGTLWWEVSRSFNATDIRNSSKTVSINTTIDKTANRWVYNGTSNGIFTLPQRSLINDGLYYFKNESGFSLTINIAVTDVIFTNKDETSVILKKGESISLFDNGTKWEVIGRYIPNNGYTVATLPTGLLGDNAFVTDATSPTYLGSLTGGGSVKCPVFHNGTAWVSH